MATKDPEELIDLQLRKLIQYTVKKLYSIHILCFYNVYPASPRSSLYKIPIFMYIITYFVLDSTFCIGETVHLCKVNPSEGF